MTATGTPIALLFLAFQITFQLLGALDAPKSDFSEFVKWGIVGARAALWYGFLTALIAAELFAARAMKRLVGQSLRGPSKHELEAMLRGPLRASAAQCGCGSPTTPITSEPAKVNHTSDHHERPASGHPIRAGQHGPGSPSRRSSARRRRTIPGQDRRSRCG